ncbi:hypothetical protein DPMN_075259 [Dreissena polymorpha]|uniref:Uncharacterized protein n=1 Tax=Dreissena polymorpha TaxID=45954 RepID=A0A9D3YJ82_DREPO|nr:hypothetical protein DPMN_075259 [Dreissena polymorpha]
MNYRGLLQTNTGREVHHSHSICGTRPSQCYSKLVRLKYAFTIDFHTEEKPV